MRLFAANLFLALVLAPLCRADASSSASKPGSVVEALTKIPECAVECLVSAFSTSTCALTDDKCICSNKKITEDGTSCILASCRLVDALATKNITETVCHSPIRDRSVQYDTLNISLGVITAVLVPIRLVFKRYFSNSKKLSPDDWVIFVALFFTVTCVVINVKGLTDHGLGRDVWTLQPDQITGFVRWFYVMEILYLAAMSLLKLSLSFFYLYIFPGTTIRRLLMGTVVFNVLVSVAFILTAIFQCSPISYYWTQYVKHTDTGRCININAFGWGNAAIGVTVDVWMIALPLSQLSRLRLHWKKKIGIAIMFMTGAVVTVVSVLRLKSLIFFANSLNPTWDQWTVAWWSTLEVNIGMICTCLPAIRLILVRMFPKAFSTKSSQNESTAVGHDPGMELDGSSTEHIWPESKPKLDRGQAK